jgi:DNA processing protein
VNNIMGSIHWLQLALTPGLGPILLKRLLDTAGSVEAACSATVSLLRAVEGIGPAKADAIARGLALAAADVPVQIKQAEDRQVRILCPDDEEYPPLLRKIHDPPSVLFARGSLEARDLNAFAIVGSRGCSFYGREQANRFASSLAGIGFTIVSGGARGTDSSAHQGALAHPAGRTIAVLGCGLDQVYPPENAALFDQIAQRGAILSEFPFGMPPLSENFPRRNRIVSGMSRGVLVVEADVRSGALITARLACEQDRPVYAMPGRIDNKLSSGPHLLIREGAALVTGLQDIVDDLPPLPDDLNAPIVAQPTQPTLFEPKAERAEARKENVPLTEQQQVIVKALGDDSAQVDTLIERTQLPAHIILQELTMLSLKGIVRRVDGQTYQRK